MSERLPAFRLGYQRSLDGLRGMAIAMVLLYHGRILGRGFGFVGVNTFFVLSGFLISSLLVAEWDQNKSINFRDFYIRRALRLLPALGVMLFCLAIFVALTIPAGQRRPEVMGILAALFYFTNWAQIFFVGTGTFLEHAWSLSVEEQFYIVWPIVLCWLLRTQTRTSASCWIFLFALSSVTARFLVFSETNIANNNPDHMTAGLDMRADSLLMGCLGGIVISSNFFDWQKIGKKFLGVSGPISLAGIILLARFRPMSAEMICFGWALASVFALILVLTLITSVCWLHFLFENSILVKIGQISYGLYLWHYPILVAMQKHHVAWQNLVYLLVVIPIVLASYYFVEKPCLRLKNRFAHAR